MRALLTRLLSAQKLAAMPAKPARSNGISGGTGRPSSSAAQATLGCRARGARLVDPLSLPIAVNADRRQVADPGEVRQGHQLVAEMPEHHVAFEVRRDADEQMRGAGQQVAHLGGGAVALER